MDTGFTIVHISDLHIGKASPTSLKALVAGIRAFIKETPPTRFLVVSGDVVDSPSKKNLQSAKTFLDALARDLGFHDVLLVRGNHDAKRVGGSHIETDRFTTFFNPTRTIDGPGVRLVGIDSNGGAFSARGRVGDAEYDEFQIRSSDTLQDDVKPLTIVVVHHHPLPIATGEGFFEYGVDDEQFMYLARPATFLEACVRTGVPLILHGHRHVTGFARYSVLAQRPTPEDADAWQNIYVLSCPSSTGVSGEKAGFNVIVASPDDTAALKILRIQRQGQGPFAPIDHQLPKGGVRLPLSMESRMDLDPALRLATTIARTFPERVAPETQLYPLLHQLFDRRAFAATEQESLPHLLYAVITVHVVWEREVAPRLRAERHEAATRVVNAMYWYEDRLSQHLGISGSLIDDWRSRYVYDKSTFIRNVPVHRAPTEEVLDEKREFLARLRGALRDLGVEGESALPDSIAELRSRFIKKYPRLVGPMSNRVALPLVLGAQYFPGMKLGTDMVYHQAENAVSVTGSCEGDASSFGAKFDVPVVVETQLFLAVEVRTLGDAEWNGAFFRLDVDDEEGRRRSLELVSPIDGVAPGDHYVKVPPQGFSGEMHYMFSLPPDMHRLRRLHIVLAPNSQFDLIFRDFTFVAPTA